MIQGGTNIPIYIHYYEVSAETFNEYIKTDQAHMDFADKVLLLADKVNKSKPN